MTHTTHYCQSCGCIEAELSSLRAQLAEVTKERDLLSGGWEHERAMIRRALAEFVTDCSTPPFILAQSAAARLRECEGALEPFLDPDYWPTKQDRDRAASLLRQPEPSGEGGPLAGAKAQKGGE